MTFNVYNQLTRTTDYTYKLIQLPKGLVEYMKKDAGKPLQFKAPTKVTNLLTICTDKDTYNVRQMNHLNTQLIVNDMAINELNVHLDHTAAVGSKQLLAVGLASYIYELTETEGQIETDQIPVYDGPRSDLLEATKTLADVRNDSPIAAECFMQTWHELGGTVVAGKAVIMAPSIITDVLHTIISLMIADDMSSFELDGMAAIAAEQNPLFTRDLISTVAHKFSNSANETFTLDKERVAKWFGYETLRNQKTALSEKELLLEWKASLPPFYNASLDLKLLLGNYCRPNTGKIRYLRAESLSSDLHTRIKEMFQIVKEWDYDEFLPFVRGFVPSSKKPDAVILKYARKKRLGKKFVVCPR